MTSKKAAMIFTAVAAGSGLLSLVYRDYSSLSTRNAERSGNVPVQNERPDSRVRSMRQRNTISPAERKIRLTPEFLSRNPALFCSIRNSEDDLDSLRKMGLTRPQAMETHEKLAAAYASLTVIREAKTKGRFHELQDVVTVPGASSTEIGNIMSTLVAPNGVDSGLFATVKQVAFYQFTNVFSDDQEVRVSTSGPQYSHGSDFRFLVSVVGGRDSQQVSYDALCPGEGWLNFLVTDDLKKLYSSIHASAQKE